MVDRLLLGVVVLAVSVACGGTGTENQIPSPRAPEPMVVVSAPATLRPLAAPFGCSANTDADHIAESLVEMLEDDDGRNVQFALDSLRLIQEDSLPFLVCQMASEAPVTVRDLYWLNRGPHFELLAHYSPKTVGEAVVVVLGAPPGEREACDGGSAEGRVRCEARWKAHLRRRPSAPAPRSLPGGPTKR